MSQFYDPNSKTKTLDRWRVDNRVRAMGLILACGGTVSGKHLAAVLGVSPRALRLLLVKDGAFLVEYRYSEKPQGGKGTGRIDEAWYRINPAKLPPEPANLPALRLRLNAPTDRQSKAA